MYDRSSSWVLRWLKVPPEPHPPHGDPASLRVFRAGRNLYRLRLAGWALGQVAALAGIVFWLVVFVQVETAIQARQRAGGTAPGPLSAKDFRSYIERIGAEANPAAPAGATNPTPGSAPAAPEASAANDQGAQGKTESGRKRKRYRISGWTGFTQIFVELGSRLPAWSFPLIWALKILGFVVYVVQVPLTYAVRRLDYEWRWYMVTDRSLRIRHGIWKVSEATMSFANIQQVEVSQGPLQRLLGLADVKVQSAGGGSGAKESHHSGADDMHLGLFHSVTNAPEIRDLILDRLRRFRESGLGDPEEKAGGSRRPVAAAPRDDDALVAGRELLAEARALRASFGGDK